MSGGTSSSSDWPDTSSQSTSSANRALAFASRAVAFPGQHQRALGGCRTELERAQVGDGLCGVPEGRSDHRSVVRLPRAIAGGEQRPARSGRTTGRSRTGPRAPDRRLRYPRRTASAASRHPIRIPTSTNRSGPRSSERTRSLRRYRRSTPSVVRDPRRLPPSRRFRCSRSARTRRRRRRAAPPPTAAPTVRCWLRDRAVHRRPRHRMPRLGREDGPNRTGDGTRCGTSSEVRPSPDLIPSQVASSDPPRSPRDHRCRAARRVPSLAQ